MTAYREIYLALDKLLSDVRRVRAEGPALLEREGWPLEAVKMRFDMSIAEAAVGELRDFFYHNVIPLIDGPAQLADAAAGWSSRVQSALTSHSDGVSPGRLHADEWRGSMAAAYRDAIDVQVRAIEAARELFCKALPEALDTLREAISAYVSTFLGNLGLLAGASAVMVSSTLSQRPDVVIAGVLGYVAALTGVCVAIPQAVQKLKDVDATVHRKLTALTHDQSVFKGQSWPGPTL